jgi:CheY-like chemotaxis protein
VVRYAPGGLHVDGEAVRLTQVVSNIVQNASKFSPVRGRIEIATRSDEQQAVLTVKDSGIGFDPHDSSRIFDLFVRLGQDQGHASGGLGIGLTIVKSLVEMHGGHVRAHSDGPGLGATFEVRLPLASEPQRPLAAPDNARSGSSRAKGRVLVVDDNVDAAQTMAEMLRLDGFEVRAVFDGVQAVSIAREFRPEVAFVDLQMPGMSGVEVAAALKAEPWAGSLRLIALTGMGRAVDIETTRRAGFENHLTKPAGPGEIARLAANGESNVISLFGTRPLGSH